MLLSAVLDLPTFREARPEVLIDRPGPPVEWVHSSEILEIAPLLSGGELLLTTGLGLVGQEEERIAAYAEQIGRAGAAGVCLELGRSFSRAPDALVRGCEVGGLSLILLHSVVPFVRLSRAANERILDHEASTLRHVQRVVLGLTQDLAEGRGMEAMIERLAREAGGSAQLVARDGVVLAEHGVDGCAGAGAVTADGATGATVTVHGEEWGRLELRGPGAADLSGRVEPLVVLALAQTSSARASRSGARHLLVTDVIAGRVRSDRDLLHRVIALSLPSDGPVQGVAAAPTPKVTSVRLRSALEIALAERGIVAPCVEHDGYVVALIMGLGLDRAGARGLVGALDRALGGEAVAAIGLGPVDGELRGARDSLLAALRLVARAPDRRLMRGRVLSSIDGSLADLIASADDGQLATFVERSIGPLFDHDSRSGRPLLPTLVAYVEAGGSKVAAAHRLRVRRQTVDERLRRIGQLLDVDLDDSQHRFALQIAVVVWQRRLAGSRGGDARRA